MTARGRSLSVCCSAAGPRDAGPPPALLSDSDCVQVQAAQQGWRRPASRRSRQLRRDAARGTPATPRQQIKLVLTFTPTTNKAKKYI